MTNLPSQNDVLSCTSIYGDPRNKRNPAFSSTAWQKEFLVPLVTPFTLYYAGSPAHLKINKHCKAIFEDFFNELWIASGKNPAVINQWRVNVTGGSFCYRLMRDGHALSMHSFGCAIDLDPAFNGLRDNTPRFAKYPKVIEAGRKVGLCWGGDWDGDGSNADQRMHDGMHWQATQKVG